jgi:hypothetical protein
MNNMELFSESDGPAIDSNENPASLARARRWMFMLLLVIPLAIMLGKLSVFPTAAGFRAWFSLTDLPKHMQPHVEYILFVPLSAVVVSFFRLTLGLPVLSLFRPILVAIAFRIIGVPLGLAFLAVVLGTVLLLRPLLKGAHYYARVPLQLSLVAMFLVLPLIAGKWWHEDWLRHLAYFPIISLCLICEAFTKSLDRKGLAAAAWPTLNTVLIGIIISLAASVHGALHLLLRFPELLVAQAGLVLFIGEYLHFEILKGKNLLVSQRTQEVESLRSPYAAPSIGLAVE